MMSSNHWSLVEMQDLRELNLRPLPGAPDVDGDSSATGRGLTIEVC